MRAVGRRQTADGRNEELDHGAHSSHFDASCLLPSAVCLSADCFLLCLVIQPARRSWAKLAALRRTTTERRGFEWSAESSAGRGN